jgi:type I restriction enzyme R subunit
VVTIFTYGVNEDDADANGMLDEPDFDIKTDDPKTQHSREKLEQYVADYNTQYKTHHAVKDSKAFYSYYKDITKRLKERDKDSFKDKDRADILLVVNMFLTGFDAKKLNTMYVDKNFKYHGLIQTFSRTNRILGELKSQGNIIFFRNLKQHTDDAIKLFCDTQANEDILMEPYEFYVEQFNKGLDDMLALADTPDAVNDLLSEDAKLAFVKSYRHLARNLNKLKPFTEFGWHDLDIDEQTFADYQSKYLDIYDNAHDSQPGASILEQIDFELELIHRDEINVAYILALLGQLHQQQKEQGETVDNTKATKDIIDLLGKEVQLRSKRELIEQFIEDYMPKLTAEQDLQQMFVGLWHQQKRAEIHQFCQRESLDKDGVYRLIDEYHFTGKDPLWDQFFEEMDYKPKLMERKKIYTRVLNDFKTLIHKYEDDTGDLGLGEDPAEYHSAPLTELAHQLGDSEIFFSDEVKHSDLTTELARFSIKLDQPYEQRLAGLQAYEIGSELLGRGVVNDDILTAYLSLTAEMQISFAEYELDFGAAAQADDGMLFWSLSEAREGSTVLEFLLNVWGYTLAIGGPIMAFLAAYPKAADGLERLKSDIDKRFKKQPTESPIILIKDIRQGR